MNNFNYNGKIYKEGSVIIGADNRGLRYGDGLFETIKMLNGKLILEDEHFARLWKGMGILQFEIPKHFTPELLQKEIINLVKKNNHESAGRIRLSILRGDGGLYDAKNHFPSYLIQTWQLPEGNGEWNSNGLVVGIYNAAKKSCDILSNIKHNNYLTYVLGALHAKKEKWNDAIILNTHERICDATIANIFIIKNNVVFTPALNEGCVAGVMRKTIIKHLLETNIEIVETELTINQLENADEVFLSNSVYNIRWVKSIGAHSYTNSYTQQIFASIFSTIS